MHHSSLGPCNQPFAPVPQRSIQKFSFQTDQLLLNLLGDGAFVKIPVNGWQVGLGRCGKRYETKKTLNAKGLYDWHLIILSGIETYLFISAALELLLPNKVNTSPNFQNISTVVFFLCLKDILKKGPGETTMILPIPSTYRIFTFSILLDFYGTNVGTYTISTWILCCLETTKLTKKTLWLYRRYQVSSMTGTQSWVRKHTSKGPSFFHWCVEPRDLAQPHHSPKMDGLEWKTLFLNGWFGGTTIFGNIPIESSHFNIFN